MDAKDTDGKHERINRLHCRHAEEAGRHLESDGAHNAPARHSSRDHRTGAGRCLAYPRPQNAPQAREVVIKLARAGEIFGEVVLFEQDRFPVSTCALTAEAQVFLLPKKQFDCAKQRYLSDQIFRLSTLDVEQPARMNWAGLSAVSRGSRRAFRSWRSCAP